MRQILVVDDSEVMHSFMRLLLTKKKDCQVRFLKNGQEALEMARVFLPDLILLDLSMPVMNGLEAACALKREMPMTPIIVFSEYGDVLSEQEARSTGISAVVSKTDSLTILLDRARSVFYPLAA